MKDRDIEGRVGSLRVRAGILKDWVGISRGRAGIPKVGPGFSRVGRAFQGSGRDSKGRVGNSKVGSDFWGSVSEFQNTDLPLKSHLFEVIKVGTLLLKRRLETSQSRNRGIIRGDRGLIFGGKGGNGGKPGKKNIFHVTCFERNLKLNLVWQSLKPTSKSKKVMLK